MSVIAIDLPKIANYQASGLIYQSSRTRVYRARNGNDGQSVVIKLMRNEYPSFQDLVQFRNQYAIAKNLEIEGIVKPYTLEHYQNRYALIMEDFGGISLGNWQSERENRNAIAEFLNIAIQLTEILQQLHQNKIIHKDIKPANILIHPETQQVKLIDFSISSLLPKEAQTLQTLNVLEGTLAYLSPEQTGRMNRGIDYRSDFYSLGVTFYELLTGKLPFATDDPLELIHCHIAKIPPVPLIKGGGDNWEDRIPTSIANIVMKLMAKNAEDRYQSAFGLKCDLEQCRSQWQTNETIEPFVLGERDLCDRFNIPEKLYGREKEVQLLLDAFVRVASPEEKRVAFPLQTRTEMMLVTGYSGIGKTAVINEVHKPITRQHGYFIKGKFDQFNRNIPFSAFVQAFRSLMGQLLGESDSALARWKTTILEALGESGQVLIEVIPELERIIGSQPSVPELSGSAARDRFNLLFGQFIRAIATPAHPLVIFLDDLQWVDSASLNLFKLLMEGESGYLLVLGAYRDHEVFPAHPLMLTLEEIRQQQAIVNTLTLEPLREEDIDRLVAESLHCSVEIAQPLSRLVYQKTRGNPFFATQFLQGLYEDGWISFLPPQFSFNGKENEGGYWQCDLTRVRQLALTDDVVAFMVGRLQKLPEETQNILKIAACTGNQFDLATLATVCEQNREEVAANLWRSLQVGLVIPENETYKFFQGEERTIEIEREINVRYRFLHDRVQQAAYSLIEKNSKQASHLKIGRLLLEKMTDFNQDDRLFNIVNNFNLGIDLVSDLQERQKLA
ncbi:MAG: serine/threonine-protein kinase PknK, partial [Cyanobacteria bacterium P01_E01_bin.42]